MSKLMLQSNKLSLNLFPKSVHFFNDFNTAPGVYDEIRSTCDGPLTMAQDMKVWNVTKDDIKVREIVFQESVWSPPLVNYVEVDRSIMETESEWTLSGVLDVIDIIDKAYKIAKENMALTLSLMFRTKSGELIKTLLSVIITRKPYSQHELKA